MSTARELAEAATNLLGAGLKSNGIAFVLIIGDRGSADRPAAIHGGTNLIFPGAMALLQDGIEHFARLVGTPAPAQVSVPTLKVEERIGNAIAEKKTKAKRKP